MTACYLNTPALVARLEQQFARPGWSLRAVARETGISPSTLSRLRHGRNPDADTLVTLLLWLGEGVEPYATCEWAE